MKITKENIKELVGRRFKSNSVSYNWTGTITDINYFSNNIYIVYDNHPTQQLSIDTVVNALNRGDWFLLPEPPEKKETQPHYDNTNGSLYLFAHQHGLNFWEADAVKRIVRCRKKGEFESDIKKTIAVLELYLKEYENTK